MSWSTPVLYAEVDLRALNTQKECCAGIQLPLAASFQGKPPQAKSTGRKEERGRRGKGVRSEKLPPDNHPTRAL